MVILNLVIRNNILTKIQQQQKKFNHSCGNFQSSPKVPHGNKIYY